MVHYAMRDDLSYCSVDERLVFLDIGSDRYFQLPYPLEQAFLAYVNGGKYLDPGMSKLIERSILVEQTSTVIGTRPNIQLATRSAMEAAHTPPHIRIRELIEVFAIVLRTRLDIKSITLKCILDGLAADRRRQIAQTKSLADVTCQCLADAADVFRRARLYVPIEMRCLLDTIAMTRFLLRRRIHACIVFGIALDPFSAHCWVQVGDLVLNDTVGNVASHTTIRVV